MKLSELLEVVSFHDSAIDAVSWMEEGHTCTVVVELCGGCQPILAKDGISGTMIIRGIEQLFIEPPLEFRFPKQPRGDISGEILGKPTILPLSNGKERCEFLFLITQFSPQPRQDTYVNVSFVAEDIEWIRTTPS